MLDSSSSTHSHRAKNVVLVILSLTLLPVDFVVLLLALLFRELCGSTVLRRRERIRQDSDFRPHRILVTGIGMTKGLVLARAFFKAGHDVVGADFGSIWEPVSGQSSKAIDRFYNLAKPGPGSGLVSYVENLKEIIIREKIELWVSCSGVVSSIEDGYAKEIIERDTGCASIQFDQATTSMLHEKNSFIEHIQQLGLKVPETHLITNIEHAQTVLRNTKQDFKYIMKPVGVDDINRASTTLLPQKSPHQTDRYLSKLEITREKPWILQEFVQGEEYCTQALVVRGRVKAFVACPSTDLLMHYEPLPKDSRINTAMLNFTRKVAAHGGSNFTGHLSFDFLVPKRESHSPSNRTDFPLYPIECNPRCHTAVVLFQNDSEDLCNAYLSALKPKDTLEHAIVTPTTRDKYYWTGHDIVALLLVPIFHCCLGRLHIKSVSASCILVVKHLLFWRDSTFEFFDPSPWWLLYHICWPMRFTYCFVFAKRWSRINVSTTKMFEC